MNIVFCILGGKKMTKYNENTKKEFITIMKTFMFFEKDIKELNSNGWTAKEIFRLGILAKKNNPQMLDRITQLEEREKFLSNRVSNLSQLFNKTSLKLSEIQKKLGLD